ncbi:hypothetical protein VDGD_21696 [Verticillium dahliae]|nr:hypothetical protein VDGD_21696 [Verticillium dahliae]
MLADADVTMPLWLAEDPAAAKDDAAGEAVAAAAAAAAAAGVPSALRLLETGRMSLARSVSVVS